MGYNYIWFNAIYQPYYNLTEASRKVLLMRKSTLQFAKQSCRISLHNRICAPSIYSLDHDCMTINQWYKKYGMKFA